MSEAGKEDKAAVATDADVPDTSGEIAATPKHDEDAHHATPITHRDKRNKYILHGLQAAGGIGLVVSAIVEGNIGRLATGGANAARNLWQLTTLFNTKSRGHERKNEVKMNIVSAGTNIPQLLTAASLHEAGAAGSAVVAYGLRTARYKFSRKLAQKRADLPPAGHTALNILIKSTNKVLRYGPSVMLMSRALAQTTDGLARQDWAAFGSGVAFTLGAIFMAVSDRKRGQVAKQIKEEKREKKLQHRQEERELEVIRELDPAEQLEHDSKDHKPKKQKKPDQPVNDNAGPQHLPKRAAARKPKI